MVLRSQLLKHQLTGTRLVIWEQVYALAWHRAFMADPGATLPTRGDDAARIAWKYADEAVLAYNTMLREKESEDYARQEREKEQNEDTTAACARCLHPKDDHLGEFISCVGETTDGACKCGGWIAAAPAGDSPQ